MRKGKTIALTGADNENFSDRLRALGMKPLLVHSITLERKPLSTSGVKALENLSRFDWIIFTSKHAVDFFKAELYVRGIRMPAHPAGPNIAAIGPATAAALARGKIKAHVIPKKFSSAELGKIIAKNSAPGKRVLFPRSAIASNDVVKLVRAAGAIVTIMPLYDTLSAVIAKDLIQQLEQGKVNYIVFTSPSSIKGIMKNVKKKAAVRAIPAICIGPTTAAAAKVAGIKTIYRPKQATNAAIIDLLKVLP